ncbi:MAG: DNA polymerase III subunit delta' [Gammaproteobacteria bacterium]
MNANAYPWHQAPFDTIVAALAEQRLSHGLLIHGVRGLGKGAFAQRLATRFLCATSTACGSCPACHWVAADNHPDFYQLAPEEDKRSISVDQVRALIGKLSLSSLANGRKVAIIDPADAMTEAAANALLKTLEEPTGDSVLMLVTHRLSALPATIHSRCQSVGIPRPDHDQALAWLGEHAPGDVPWPALLRLAGGAPLAALEWHKEGFSAQVEQLSADLVAISDGQLDPAAAAARWVKMDAGRCIEWLARRVSDVIRVRFGVASRDVAHNLSPKDLPEGLNQIKLNQMFAYLDNVHRARRRLDTSLNAQQVIEALLVPWALRFRTASSVA